MNEYFVYNNEKHFIGTIVRMNKEVFQKKYGTNTQCFEFKFVRYNQYSNSYYFEPIDEHTYVIDIGEKELNEYIDNIVVKCMAPTEDSELTVNEFEVPGMATAWVWFVIFFIVLLLFHNGIICAAVFAIAFFYYRKNKIKNYKSMRKERK